MSLKVVTDSAADIPEDMARDLDVSIVPLVIVAGDRAYDETDLTRDEFWELFRRVGRLSTSQPSVGAFHRVFQRLVDKGHDVLSISLTSRHSGTYSSARTAAQAFGERVTAVDSLGISLVQGFQAITAARMASAGSALAEILDAVRSVRERTQVHFQLHTLEHLRRGGRAAALMPALDRVAKVLNLSVVLTLTDGELKLAGLARTYRKGVQRIKDELLRAGPLERLAVVHSRVPDVAQEVYDDLLSLTGVAPENALLTELGAALSCHGGEGMLGAMGVVHK